MVVPKPPNQRGAVLLLTLMCVLVTSTLISALAIQLQSLLQLLQTQQDNQQLQLLGQRLEQQLLTQHQVNPTMTSTITSLNNGFTLNAQPLSKPPLSLLRTLQQWPQRTAPHLLQQHQQATAPSKAVTTQTPPYQLYRLNIVGKQAHTHYAVLLATPQHSTDGHQTVQIRWRGQYDD